MFTVSDGLLPLLDVTLLLLGLFMVILGVVASDVSSSSDSKNLSISKATLPSSVILLRIDKNHEIFLSGKKVLNNQLVEQLGVISSKKKKAIILLQIENIWDPNSNKIFKQCRESIQNANLHYARVY